VWAGCQTVYPKAQTQAGGVHGAIELPEGTTSGPDRSYVAERGIRTLECLRKAASCRFDIAVLTIDTIPGEAACPILPDGPVADLLETERREGTGAKNWLHYLLRQTGARELSPAVLESIAQIDGSVVLDRDSRLLAFGAILLDTARR
jgi:hypothetical protein